MVQMNQEDAFRLPTERIAQLLMECAKLDPTLVGRPQAVAAGIPDDPGPMNPGARLPSYLQADPVPGIGVRLDDLISVAMASAEQAVDALRQAREARRSARRSMVGSMAVCAGISVLGILIGVARTDDNHVRGDPDTAPREVSEGGPANRFGAPKSQATDPGAGAMSPQAGSDTAQSAAPAVSDDVQPVAPTPAAASSAVLPVYHGPAAQAAPWQISTPPVRRIGTASRRPATPVGFVTAFRRDLKALFQAFSR
jgi:hypothetical protein